MRRIAWALMLGVVLFSLSACHWNWSDPLHPTVCPRTEDCAPKCSPLCPS